MPLPVRLERHLVQDSYFDLTRETRGIQDSSNAIYKMDLSSRICPTRLCGECGSAFTHASYKYCPSEYLRSNLIPSDGEASTIGGYRVDELDKDIARYDLELERLKHVVALLEEEKRRVELYRDHWTSVWAPIRRLPEDILERVFYENREDVFAMFRLGAVCAHWRAVVNKSGRLWSRITVNTFKDKYWGSGEEKVDTLRFFLERSKGCPLWISLLVNDDGTPFKDQTNELLLHSPRWKELYLTIVGKSRNDPKELEVLSQVRGRLDTLEVLHIFNDFRRSSIFSLFADAPKLHTVTCLTRFDPLMFGLPWHQLTDLTCGHAEQTTVSTVLELLGLCPVLHTVCFFFYDAESAPAWTGDRTLRSRIRHLSLYFLSPTDENTFLANLFASLVAEDLIALHIKGKSRCISTPWPEAQFANFLKETSNRLETLDLGYLYVDPASLLRSLQHTPNLRTLSLENNICLDGSFPGTGPFFFEALTYNTSPAVLVPRLSKFEFVANESAYAVPYRALVDMIRSRANPWATWDAVPALEKVLLDFKEASNLEPQFDQLRAEGLRVSFVKDPFE